MIAKEEESVYLFMNLFYNICKDLHTNNYDIETLIIETENKKSKNILNVI